jgi:hypothetical protein
LTLQIWISFYVYILHHLSCYTKREIFHNLHLLSTYYNPYWERLPWFSHYLSFSTFISTLHYTKVSVSLSIMLCTTVSFLTSTTK